MSTNLNIAAIDDLDGEVFGDTVSLSTGGGGGGSGSSLATSLMASWKLDDTSDASGNGHTLTTHSNTFNTGKIGNCAYFVGASNQWLSLANHADVQMGNIDFTIGCWVYLDSKTARMQIVAKDSDVSSPANREYELFYDQGTDRFTFTFFNAAGTSFDAVANTFGSPSITTWYCLIGGFNTATGFPFISVNNGTVDEGGTGTPQTPGTAELRIGARVYSGFQDYFDGRIDDVNIWKRVLTPTEKTTFYNSGNGLEYPFE